MKLIVFVVLLSSVLTYAQSGAAQNSARVVLNGALEPQKVPDNIAWLMLFKLLEDRPDGLAYNARAAFLRPSAFTKDQIHQIIQTAAEANNRIRQVEAEVAVGAVPNQSTTDILRSRRDAILTDAVAALLVTLGPEGAATFMRHIDEHVKPRIIQFVQ